MYKFFHDKPRTQVYWHGTSWSGEFEFEKNPSPTPNTNSKLVLRCLLGGGADMTTNEQDLTNRIQ